MFPILFHFGPLTVYSYGFFLALAFATCLFLMEKEARRVNIDARIISDLLFLGLVSGIIGARLFFIFLNLDFFKANPSELIKLWHGGLVWYGGLISALTCSLLYLKLKKQSVFKIFDFIAPYIALGQSIGRIGCFLNGCCFGKEWGVGGLYPTQIFSSFLMLVAFIILRNLSERKLKTGSIILLYLAFYSAKRFFIEFLRGDSPLVFLSFTVFQLISAGIFLVVLFILIYRLAHK